MVRKLPRRPGDVFVDGGANIGYYTLMSAELVGPQGKVFAFEPEPRNYSQLKANIVTKLDLNDGRIIAHQLALGDQKVQGAATIYLERDNLGAHSLHPGNPFSEINSEASVPRGPPRDDAVLPANQHIDVIKLDTPKERNQISSPALQD